MNRESWKCEVCICDHANGFNLIELPGEQQKHFLVYW